MAQPHKCPVCNGTGKMTIPPPPISNIAVWDHKINCSACGGTGIVWENGVTTHPNEPFLPRPPEFVPYDPIVPLTFPKDYKFPEDIQEASKDKLIKILKEWIKDLEE